ncbi:MAG: hypothetical protein FWF10_02975 [Clostridiales bacterium]|nr:hypothetical protein [Clostridiales bacterium]
MSRKRRFQYADEYIIVENQNKRGKTRKAAAYRGPSFSPQLTPEALRAHKWLSIGMALTIIALLINALSQLHAAQFFIFFSLPLACALIPGMYLVAGAVEMKSRVMPLERAQYDHSFRRVVRSTWGIIACVGISCLGFCIYWCMAHAARFGSEDLTCIYSMLLAVCVSLLLGDMQKRIQIARTEYADLG